MEVRSGGVATANHSIGQASRRKSQIVEVDVERYQDLLDSADLSAEQKAEFLRALWSIIIAFIDLGYGVHPAQQALPAFSPERSIGHIAAEFVRRAARSIHSST